MSSKFDRSKYKSKTTMETLEHQTMVADANMAYGNKIGFHDIKTNGKYVMRIYPAHPDTESFWYPYSKAFLPFVIKEVKDGKETGKTKEKRFPVFNSKFHAGTKKDIIEEYIDLCYRQAKEDISDVTKRNEHLAPFSSFRDTIRPKTTWVVYTDLITGRGDNQTHKFGILEVSLKMRKALNSMAMDATDDILDIDPYSDPDDGRAFVITRSSNDDGSNVEYTVFTKDKGAYPISDERLEAWLDAPTLESGYVDSYDMNTFKRAMEGLETFDKKFEMGVFGTDEWSDIVKEVQSYYPEAEDEGEPKNQPVDESEVDNVKPVVEEKEEVEVSLEAALALMTMDELKGYIKENKLPIRPRKNDTADDLVEIILEEMEIAEGDNVTDEVVEKTPEKEDKEDLPWEKNGVSPDATKPKAKEKTSDRLSKIRKNLKDKTGASA